MKKKLEFIAGMLFICLTLLSSFIIFEVAFNGPAALGWLGVLWEVLFIFSILIMFIGRFFKKTKVIERVIDC